LVVGLLATVVLIRLLSATPPPKAPTADQPLSLDDLFPEVEAEMAAQVAFLRDLYQSYVNQSQKGS
jgi:hypothetical protein